MKTNRRLLIIITTVLITFSAINHGTCKSPDEITGAEWMSWDRQSRSVFVMGFFGGYIAALKILGADLRAKEGVTITWTDISDDLYKVLRDKPSVRNHNMGSIIQAYMEALFVVTDRNGVPL